MKKRFSVAAILGNLLEHYDTALFGLLAPLLAPVFFPKDDLVVSLIKTYSMLPLSFFAKFCGAYVFGRFGDMHNRNTALRLSLSGTALCTWTMGFLPTYSSWGMYASLLLLGMRLLQSFCAAGETAGGALILLETRQRRGWLSSLFDASSTLGGLLASVVIAYVGQKSLGDYCWRIPFWLGGLTATISLFLRMHSTPSVEKSNHNVSYTLLWKERHTLLRISVMAGFSYLMYAFSFSFLGGYLPLISPLSFQEIIQANQSLFLFDILCLIGFGALSLRIQKPEIFMKWALRSAFLFGIPAFMLLHQSSWMMMLCVRMLFVLIGTSFAATFYAWALDQLNTTPYRQTLLALSLALGSQLIGASIPAVALGLYRWTGWPIAPGLLLVAFTVYAYRILESPIPNKSALTLEEY